MDCLILITIEDSGVPDEILNLIFSKRTENCSRRCSTLQERGCFLWSEATAVVTPPTTHLLKKKNLAEEEEHLSLPSPLDTKDSKETLLVWVVRQKELQQNRTPIHLAASPVSGVHFAL
ncbi:hypothetical protein J6590_059788 [Homalodisca vitripennis]|nr:hypothetical protein J6590_059788 [Homalodisca vitripennis]